MIVFKIIRLDRGREYYGKKNEWRQCLGPFVSIEIYDICA